jgi:hypothetical protein
MDTALAPAGNGAAYQDDVRQGTRGDCWRDLASDTVPRRRRSRAMRMLTAAVICGSGWSDYNVKLTTSMAVIEP